MGGQEGDSDLPNGFCIDSKSIKEGCLGGLVSWLSLSFSSGGDVASRVFKPLVGLHDDSVEPGWDSLSLSPSLCPSPAHAHSLSK